MALRQSTRFRAATAFLGVLSFVLAVVVELKKPPYGTPIRGADMVVCRFPPDPTVAPGALTALVAACCFGIGAVSVFFPYDGSVVTVAGIGMTTWTTATEAHVRSVHRDLGYACPTAETGLFGAAAFLNLDASLFWLVRIMLAGNVREDYFDGQDEVSGDGGAVIEEK